MGKRVSLLYLLGEDDPDPRGFASLRAQSYPDIELVVVVPDDAGRLPDWMQGPLTIVEISDPKPQNRFDYAWRLAEGDIVFAVPAHAVLNPELVSRYAGAMEKESASIVFGDFFRESPEGDLIPSFSEGGDLGAVCAYDRKALEAAGGVLKLRARGPISRVETPLYEISGGEG